MATLLLSKKKREEWIVGAQTFEAQWALVNTHTQERVVGKSLNTSLIFSNYKIISFPSVPKISAINQSQKWRNILFDINYVNKIPLIKSFNEILESIESLIYTIAY